MTTAILKFDLNDPEDTLAFKQANVSVSTLGALYDIKSHLCYHYKHKDLTDEQNSILEEIKEVFFEALNENNINLDDLYS